MQRRPVSFPWHRALSVVRNISDTSDMTTRALLSLLTILFSVLASRGDVRVWRLGEAEGMPQTRVYCVIQTRDGYIWMATRDGLVRFDGAHARVFKTRPSDRGLLPGNHFRHIYENDRGELCAKIEETYYLFDRLTERFDTMPQPLSPPRRPPIPDSITAAIQGLPQFRGHETRVLFNDRQEGWWVESPEGISRVLFTTTFPTPVKDCPEGEEAVRGLMRDRSGRVWTADKNGYVRVSSDSATRWLGPDGRLHDTRIRFGHNVYTMAEHDGGLWLGTKPDGLYRLRGDSLTYMDGIAGNAVYGIIADMEGHIFVGTYDAGLSVITDPESPHPVIKTVRGIPGVRALLRIPQGDIIAGTDNGVYVTGYDGREVAIRKHLLDGSVLMGIAPGPEENEVMVATYGDGLIRLGLTSGKSDTLTTADGLASDICLSLARTPGGGYLVTSEHSVSLFPDDGSPVRIFGPELFGGSFAFTEAAPLILPDGTAVVGTTQGILSFNPLTKSATTPRLVFSCPDTLRLPSDRHRLELTFGVLDYNRFAPARYAWRTDRDSTWHLTDGRLTFADIPAGVTRITVRGTDGTGAWTAGPRTLIIDRAPRLTERRWFWIAIGILSACALYAIARLVRYVLRLRREVRSLTIQKGEMMEYFNARLHDMVSGAPAQSTTAEPGESLMSKVNEYLEGNYNNPDIGADSLCRHLAMSHTRLYREIKEASGMTPATLIVTFRLSKAMAMFDRGCSNISEVAYACGWSDPKYFSRVFRKSKGCTPTEYMKSAHGEDNPPI